MNILLGSDPELFLSKNGEVISAEGLVGGSKHEPLFITKEGHAIQEDNVMVEFNIPPSSNKESFVNNINYVKKYLENKFKPLGLDLLIQPSSLLDSKYLKTDQSKQFGCDPDMNVYLKCVNEPPVSGGNLRVCGGHLHIGYDNPELETSEDIIKWLDIFLGLPSVWMDEDKLRKTMYGKAGCFRIKSFGVEYRTLSNFWIRDNKTISFIYENALKAVKIAINGKNNHLLEEFESSVEQCINNSDIEKSMYLYEKIINKIKK